MAEYVDFHYTPLEGRITGKQVLKQTEDAINDLGNRVYDAEVTSEDVQEALDNSQQAVDIANDALAAVTTDKAVWFNNVADMRAANLVNGNVAATKGYSLYNDGNGAFYAIRQKKGGDVYDGVNIIFLDNGSVAERINEFNLIAKKNIVYATNVAELKSSDGKIGSVFGTLGYYTLNDGGSSIYTIRAKTQEDVDDGGSIIFLDNGNVAELITEDIVNVKQFGAKGDGATDDTGSFANALAFPVDTLVIPEGNYIINDILFADKVQIVEDYGSYTNNKPIFPNHEPLCKGLEYISTYPDPTYVATDFSVGSCTRMQGLAYDSKRNKFIAGLINSDQSQQALAIVNVDTLAIESSHTFTELGHCNNLAYCPVNDCLYVSGVFVNGVVDYSVVMEIDADTYAIKRTIPLGHNIPTLYYDTVLNVFVGITASINDFYIIVYDINFNELKKTIIPGIIKDAALNGMNECVAHNGRIFVMGFMYGTSSTALPTHIMYDTDIYGNNLQKIPFPFSVEPEGACIVGDKIIFNTANGYKLNNVGILPGRQTLYQITKQRAEIPLQSVLVGEYVNSDSIDLNSLIVPSVSRRQTANSTTAQGLNYPKTNSERQYSTHGNLFVFKGGDEQGTANVTQQIFFGVGTRANKEVWQRNLWGEGNGEWHRVDCYGALPTQYDNAVGISELVVGSNTWTPDRDGYLTLVFTPTTTGTSVIFYKFMRSTLKLSSGTPYQNHNFIVRKGVPVSISISAVPNGAYFVPMD